MVARFYKGVGVGAYLYPHDLSALGIVPRRPQSPHNSISVTQHIAYGTATSPYVSLTSSYGVAKDYAIHAGKLAPTAASPAYVYELHVPDDAMSLLVDPIAFIASQHRNPLAYMQYHHDGDQDFLASVASPAILPLGPSPAQRPSWAVQGTAVAQPNLTFSAIAFALRDAEILVNGNVPASWVVNRDDVC